MIKHIWFDFSGTLIKLDKDKHNHLRYSSYAEAVKKPLDEELIKEYGKMLEKHASNSGVFRSLGLPGSYWADRVNSLGPAEYASLADPKILEVLPKLKAMLPISLFTNIHPDNFLKALGIKPNWFTHIIQGGMVKEPKPNLEGFNKMIELSKEQPQNLLYVGDSIEKDIRPAKQVGIKTCLVWEKSTEADYSIMKFEELLTIFI